MKQFRFARVAVLILSSLLFSACNRLPRQVRYIPKDALTVVGVHTGKMSKTLAWSAITGSGLLEELRKYATDKKLPEAVQDLANSGIDFSGTLYGFTRLDTRFPNKIKQAAVLPLSDNSAFESYLQKNFPGVVIHKEASLNMALFPNGFCVGWNDEVVIVMNEMVRRVKRTEAARPDTIGGMAIPMPPISWEDEIPDSAGSLAELAHTLQPATATSIDKRFVALEKSGHDISIWLSYDPLVDWYYSENEPGQSMLSASVAEMLMKGSAMTIGVDFRKGRIEGLMRYYPSDSLKDVAKEFGKENIDADMLRRLPSSDLNMAGGLHLSPALIKLLLQRLNLSGVANLALMSQGLSLDDVLGGFSGDMVFALNNFRLDAHAESTDANVPQANSVSSPKMDFVYALKLGDKARLEKLLGYAEKTGVIQVLSPGVYSIRDASGVRIVVGEKYLAISSNESTAQAFLREHAGAMPDAVHQEISGHPAGLWLDIKAILQPNEAALRASGLQVSALQKGIQSFAIQGGEMKDAANEFHFNIQMVNKRENSLLQLLQLAQQFAIQGNPRNHQPQP